MIVLFHEHQICRCENNNHQSEVDIVIDREEDEAGRDGELQSNVEDRYGGVWNMQFVGHKLVGVFAVSFAKVFMKLDAVTDSEDCVSSIDSKENDVREILSAEY